jgi:hypothetical protein
VVGRFGRATTHQFTTPFALPHKVSLTSKNKEAYILPLIGSVSKIRKSTLPVNAFVGVSWSALLAAPVFFPHPRLLPHP